MRTKRNCGIILAGVLAQVLFSNLAEAEATDALQACRAETDDARRLACYDRVIDAQSGRAAAKAAPPAAVAAPIPAPAAASAPATPVTPEEKFGYADIRARQEQEADAKDPNRISELVATVAEISRRPNGTHVITLDNGQVWVEQSLDHFFRVKVGETVRIKPAALGSFLLSTPSKHSTRVKRTQ